MLKHSTTMELDIGNTNLRKNGADLKFHKISKIVINRINANTESKAKKITLKNRSENKKTNTEKIIVTVWLIIKKPY